MEAIALDALHGISPWDRQRLGDPRHGAMERGVKTRDLGQPRTPSTKRFDQSDLAWQVIRVVWCDAPQFREERWRDALGFVVRHAVHHAVSDGPDRREDRLRFQPTVDRAHGRAVRGCRQAAGPQRLPHPIVDDDVRAAEADPIDLSVELPPRRGTCFVHGEPDARRVAIHRQDTGYPRLCGSSDTHAGYHGMWEPRRRLFQRAQ